MSAMTYFIDIASATTAKELHELKLQAETDGDLTKAECSAICDKIGRTFSAWNRKVVGQQKPRW